MGEGRYWTHPSRTEEHHVADVRQAYIHPLTCAAVTVISGPLISYRNTLLFADSCMLWRNTREVGLPGKFTTSAFIL